MDYSSYKIDNEKGKHVVFIAQMILASMIFLTEVVVNYILYKTRSQGYGPDTIVEKLIRYLLITTIINFGAVIVGQIIVRKTKDIEVQKYTLMFCIILICSNVAFSHYQFATTLLVFIIPLTISILFEDLSVSFVTFILSLVGLTVAVISRAMDPEYNTDILPEATIVYLYTFGIYIVSMIIYKTLVARRLELGKALVDIEKANASYERSRMSLKMLETLARAIDAKDSYTNGHSTRVAVYSSLIAEQLGWDKKHIEELKYEAILHDIGKIGVPDSILNKNGRLTPNEFDIIKSHTLVGADILKDMASVDGAREVALYHHERYDGKGYPHSISGTDIPLHARIVCIADAYDAMSSDRIYRKALSREVIRDELVKGRGTQFDPELLDIFLNLFDSKKLNVSIGDYSPIDNNTDHKYVMEDIENVIQRLVSTQEQSIGADDFEKFYKYMRNIGIRYNRSIEVMSVIISPAEGIIPTPEDYQAACDALEYSIKKNIRSVDVHYKYSPLIHMIILLDAGVENISIISNRISFDYKSKFDSDVYEITYELNENIGYKAK